MTLNLAALSGIATDEEETTESGPAQPVNWNPGGTWQHRPVIRATERSPRRPIIARPGNINEEDAAPGDFLLSKRYWTTSVTSTWRELCEVVNDGFTVRRKTTPCDVALFPAPSGLVVLDCDVKRYDEDTGFVVTNGVATLVPPVTRYGLNDLRREVEGLGHAMSELATYAVSTKSGGVHLYFAENPDVPLTNSGHRHDWRIDVISHNDGADRSWVAAPPTAGYTVVRDLPVAMMPTWLATWLKQLERNLPPLGRQRRQATIRRAVEARDRATLPGENDAGLLAQWVRWELQAVRDADETGGWNLAIYQCVLNLLDGGADVDSVAAAVLDAARPINDLERRRAMDTVGSAHRRYLRKTIGG